MMAGGTPILGNPHITISGCILKWKAGPNLGFSLAGAFCHWSHAWGRVSGLVEATVEGYPAVITFLACRNAALSGKIIRKVIVNGEFSIAIELISGGY